MHDRDFYIAVASLTIGCLVSFCYVPYCIWIFFADRHQPYAQKRRPYLVIALIIVVTLPSWAESLLDDDYCLFAFCNDIPGDVRTVFLFVSVSTLSLLLSCRVWLLFYDLKHGEALLRHEWWSAISAPAQQDWFIQNRNRWGSLKKYLWKRMLCVMLLMYGCLIAAAFLPSTNQSHFVLTPFIIICATFLVVLFCKMPKQYDALLIRKEINRLIIFYSFSTVWFSVSERIWEGSSLVVWFNAFYTYLFNVVVVTIMSLWPHYQRSWRRQQQQQEQQHRFQIDLNVSSGRNKRRKWTSYVNACEDDRNWNRFMRHLLVEIAIENLCFVLEVMQFKMQFVPDPATVFAEKVVVYDDEIGWFMKLPQGLPKSAIIHDSGSSCANYAEQICRIYEKYISPDALLAINVGCHARGECESDMNVINGHAAHSNVCDGRVSTSTADIAMSAVHGQDAPVGDAESKQHSSVTRTTVATLESVMQQKMMKVFDACLRDVNGNLADTFSRFNPSVVDESDVILHVMTNQQKEDDCQAAAAATNQLFCA